MPIGCTFGSTSVIEILKISWLYAELSLPTRQLDFEVISLVANR